MRSYGTPNAHDKVFLEIKKKIQWNLLTKRRTSMVLKDAYRYMRMEPFHTKQSVLTDRF